VLQGLERGQPETHAAAARSGARTVVADLQRERLVIARHRHVHARGVGVLADVADGLGQDRLRERLDVKRDDDAVRPVDAQRQPGGAGQAFQLVGQRRTRLGRQRGQRPLERAAQIAQRLLHLDPAALTFSRLERRGRAQRERDAEQALHHALVDLPRQLEALAEVPAAFLLTRGVARGGHERGRLAERPQEMALAI
jgi:hypothetical protein